MSSSWIPTWLASAWTAAFVLVLAVHLRHSLSMTGRPRLWHLTHVLMALGMIDMFWPASSMPVGGSVGQTVFLVAGVAVVALIAAEALHHRHLTLIWPMAAIDLFGMAYMFAQPAHGIQVVSVALAAWFALEALGWASGILADLAGRAGMGQPLPGPGSVLARAMAGAPAAVLVDSSGADAAVQPTAGGRSTGGIDGHDPLDGSAVRITLTLMSLGMAYMLLALQFGTTTMAGHMPGMGGM